MKVILLLFLSMLKIGCFAFGGGYAIIALLENEFISKRYWIDHDEFMDVVAIAESTPGPIAINVATYIGYKLKGFLGAVLATIGVVLPSFVIILIVAALIKNLLKYPAVKTFISSMRPALGGLILSVAATMFLTVFFGIENVKSINFAFDWRTLVILAVVVAIPILWKLISKKKKEFSSILLVIISCALGILLFGF